MKAHPLSIGDRIPPGNAWRLAFAILFLTVVGAAAPKALRGAPISIQDSRIIPDGLSVVLDGSDMAPLHGIYLPYLNKLEPMASGRGVAELREVGSLNARTEALAIRGQYLYLGAGASIITFDISHPGAAQRLSQSAVVEGQIVRLALGSDRLFALSRPAVFRDKFLWDFPDLIEPDWKEPWTLVSVFDLSDGGAPQLMDTITLEERDRDRYVNHFGVDLAAHGRTAYLTTSGDPRRDRSPGDIAIVDASGPRMSWRMSPVSLGKGFRPLVHENRLYLLGELPRDQVDQFRIQSGIMGFDLTDPLVPRWLGAAGADYLDYDLGRFNLVGQGRQLFRVNENGFLLPTEIQDDGQPILMFSQDPNSSSPHQLPESLSLAVNAYGLQRSAAAPGRLYLLLTEQGDTPVASYDVRDPLRPRRLPRVRIGDLHLFLGRIWQDESCCRPDMRSDIATADDGRVFLAAGLDGVLLELDMGDEQQPRELARYHVNGGTDCALPAASFLLRHDLRDGILSLTAIGSENHLIEIHGSTRLPGSGTCVLATALGTFGPLIYSASSAGLTVLDGGELPIPQSIGHLPLGGEPRQMVATGDRVYVAGSEGLWIVDVSDPLTPKILGHLPAAGGVQGVAVDGDRAYLAMGSAGLSVVDLRNPAAPKVTGSLLPGEEIMAVARRGDWIYASSLRGRSAGEASTVELVSLRGGTTPSVQNRLALAPGATGLMALDNTTHTDLYVQDGQRDIRLFDVTAGAPVSLNRLTLNEAPHWLVANEGWVLSGGDVLRVLRRVGP